MSSRARSSYVAALVSVLSSIGCGGGSTLPHARLPADEVELLALAPSDAFFVLRFDARALRSSSIWPSVETELEASREMEREIVRTTDRVYFAVGGLVPAPPVPARYDEQGNYVSRPAWAEAAEALSGRLPNGVLVVEGSVASICRRMLDEEGVERRSVGGYATGTKDGITIAIRGERFCAATFAPLFDGLVADDDAPSLAVSRLATVAEGGSLGIASASLELDSPAFRSLVESVGPTTATDRDADRWVPAMRRIFAILVEGISATEWQLREQDGRLESIVRVEASDEDRGIMWRELTEMEILIGREIVSALPPDLDGRSEFVEALSDVRIEPRDDGYAILARIETETIASVVRSRRRDASAEDHAIEEEAADVVPGDSIDELEGDLDAAADVTIERYERLRSAYLELTPFDRRELALAVARAYRTLGRWDDARSVLTEELDVLEVDYPIERVALMAERCELELDAGRAPEALSVGNEALVACGETYCGTTRFAATACVAAALASSGRSDDAFAKLDELVSSTDYESAVLLAAARARAMAILGRYAEAQAIADSACLGRMGVTECIDLVLIAATAAAATTTRIDSVTTRIEQAEQFVAYSASIRTTSMARVVLDTARCEALTRLSPTDPETLSTCGYAFETANGVHGPNHPRTIAAGIALVRAARENRDEALARTTLAKVDEALGRLGASHPVRAARASLGGRRPR